MTGAFTTGATIGITLSGSQTLTSGYGTYNGSTDPNTIFSHDPIVTSTGTLGPSGTLSLVGGEVYYSSPENYITEVMLVGSSSSYVSELKTKFEKDGWTFIDKNLNAGRESHPHVHLLYKSEPANAVNWDKHYITGFLLADKELDGGDPQNQETIVHDGRTYYKVPAVDDQGFIDCGGNLNYSVSNNSNKGDHIFLYYTRDKFDDSRVVKSIVFDGTESGALGDYLGQRNPLDLNRNGSGQYIYMHVGTTTGVTYTPKDQTLADNSNNSNVLTVLNGKTPNITLSGRTLWKDGSWNTLCLPFSLSASQIASSPLAGATIMELDTENKWSMVNDQWSISESGTYQTGFDASDGKLYLYFKNADEIEAGKPYIVKWTTTGDPIVNPTFNNVTITSTTPTTIEAKNSGLNTVQFIGTYGPANLVANDKAKLYIGASNNLYYPSGDMNINAFRGYFNVDLTGQPSGVRAFVLNFGDDAVETGISAQPTVNCQLSTVNWFTLDGRRMSGKPTKKGIYINNGKKIVIK